MTGLQEKLNEIAAEQEANGSCLVIVTDLAHWAEFGVLTVDDFDAYCQKEWEKEQRKSWYSEQDEVWDRYQEECRQAEAAALEAAKVVVPAKLVDACPELLALKEALAG